MRLANKISETKSQKQACSTYFKKIKNAESLGSKRTKQEFVVNYPPQKNQVTITWKLNFPYLSVFSPMRENAEQKNSEYGHFSRSISVKEKSKREATE